MSEGRESERGQRLAMPFAGGLAAANDCEPGAGPYRAYGLAEVYGQYLAMLELRFRTGNRVAFAYHLLGRAEFDPSDGIRLVFPDMTIALRGRNLAGLFTAIRQQQVIWVCEADRAVAGLIPAADALVESITVEPRGG